MKRLASLGYFACLRASFAKACCAGGVTDAGAAANWLTHEATRMKHTTVD